MQVAECSAHSGASGSGAGHLVEVKAWRRFQNSHMSHARRKDQRVTSLQNIRTKLMCCTGPTSYWIFLNHSPRTHLIRIMHAGGRHMFLILIFYKNIKLLLKVPWCCSFNLAGRALPNGEPIPQRASSSLKEACVKELWSWTPPLPPAAFIPKTLSTKIVFIFLRYDLWQAHIWLYDDTYKSYK